MSIINISDLCVTLGDRKIYDRVNLGIQENDKIGIIGTNGCGKSTLLRIIQGEFYDYTGDVTKTRGITISYLPQTPLFEDNDTIMSYVSRGGDYGDEWNKETMGKQILTELGITDFYQSISELSGGQKKRVALARALIDTSDVLILDEPTNHLDSEMIEWLEIYLKKYKGALIMVTHDRYFLDEVTNRIVEIEAGKLYEYEGNYETFLKLKCERKEMELASERKREALLRNELEWVKRGARARSTKQKFRLERYEELRTIEKIRDEEILQMESTAARMGKKTVELKNINKSYGNKQIINAFSYIFLKNDRIGIVGKNGSGKTTLLNIITGKEIPDSGEVIIGDTIRIGYFSQHNEAVDENKRVVDYIKDIAEYLPTKNGRITASQMLERFLFSPDMQYAPISKLSGGEKRRLFLLKVLMEGPNLLILDEPTNDLDIKTLNVLEDYIDSFEGIVITVSHDRYFLDRCVRRILAYNQDGTITQYMGGYSDYYNKIKDNLEAKEIKEDNDRKSENNNEKNDKKSNEKGKSWDKGERLLKFTYKEQREFETIEDDIEAIENELERIEEEMGRCVTDFVKLSELTEKKQELHNSLVEKMERWAYLTELDEKIKCQKK